jgi:hypothetical protein
MNTDNMALSGETIDYGRVRSWTATIPPRCSARSTRAGDTPTATSRRSRSGTSRLAEAMLPLFDDDADRAAEQATHGWAHFADRYVQHWIDGMRAKLGLFTAEDGDGRSSTTSWPGCTIGPPTSPTRSCR